MYDLIDIDISDLGATVTLEYLLESNYGSDIDGNRGSTSLECRIISICFQDDIENFPENRRYAEAKAIDLLELRLEIYL